ncbi:MAG: lamin tail domain-containing protein [Candidatus Omnitrophica bacterium]|nr:lamin tail domain-containing protein [Candidatus Omnitrophota bacterium]
MRRWMVGVGMAMVIAAGYRPPEAAAGIVINEVLADPAADADGDGAIHATRDEFIELVNTDAAQIDLANWTLSDAVQLRHTFGAPSVIAGRGFLVVFGSSASSGTLGLNNGGDTITLRDSGLNAIDALSFGAEGGQDVALTRLPDGDGVFGPHPLIGSLAFSPGKTISGAAQLPLPEPEPSPTPPPPAPEPDVPPPPVPLPTDDLGPAPSLPPLPPQDDELPDHSHNPVVPEPASLWLLGTGMAWLLRVHQRKERTE